MAHYKFNAPANLFWPFVRFACKACLFSWMVYGGRLFERENNRKKIVNHEELMNEKDFIINDLEAQIKKSASAHEVEENRLKTVHKHELNELRKFEDTLREKLKRYERTPAQANKDALRSFL